MEGSKGGQEPGGGLAVYVSRSELSMSLSICELSVESWSPILGSPILPFIDQGGEQGL